MIFLATLTASSNFSVNCTFLFEFSSPFFINSPVLGRHIIFSISLLFKNFINPSRLTPLSFPPTINVFTFGIEFIALIVDSGIVAIESL